MSSAPQPVAAPQQSRVSGKRLWCHRLPCGRIVAELPDGTLLLCIRKARHTAQRCFHPDAFAPPQAQCQFWRAA